jgi:PilX N-terminal
MRNQISAWGRESGLGAAGSAGGSGRLQPDLNTRWRDDRGAALVVAILIAALMTAVASALLTTTTTETLIGGAHRASQETLYAADAALERAIGALASISDWSAVLAAPAGTLMAPFDDGQAAPIAPDGRRLDLVRLLAARQAASNSLYGPGVFGADSPRWRLYGRAALSRVLGSNLAAQPAYLLVWLADDGADGDGDPGRDSNGQVALYVDGFGPAGARRAIEAGISRSGPGVVRLVSWKEVH